jgi:5-(carboxyamino)imidazole ribonucleotide mutase
MKEKIAVVLGSKNDWGEVKEGIEILKEIGVSFRLEVISAHRHPERLRRFCKTIEKDNFQIVIACAGKAAALPGVIASYVNIPVIGVGLKGGLLDGLDALLSIVSTPKGLGLVSTGIGKSAFINAIIFSMEVLCLKDKKYISKLEKLKKKFK